MRALENALLTVLLFVLLRLLLRRSWIGTAAGGLLPSIVSLTQLSGFDSPVTLLFPLVSGALLTFVVVRFGLLPSAVTLFVYTIVTRTPLTLETSHWSATASNWTLAGFIGLTLFGFYASRAGQPLFGSMRPT